MEFGRGRGKNDVQKRDNLLASGKYFLINVLAEVMRSKTSASVFKQSLSQTSTGYLLLALQSPSSKQFDQLLRQYLIFVGRPISSHLLWRFSTSRSSRTTSMDRLVFSHRLCLSEALVLVSPSWVALSRIAVRSSSSLLFLSSSVSASTNARSSLFSSSIV